MKFPKPRELLANTYPDLKISQPELIKKMVRELVRPSEKDKYYTYIETTVKYLKEAARKRLKTVKLN